MNRRKITVDCLTDGTIYKMPRDRDLYHSRYWSMREAATNWGVPYRTAVRWVHLHPDIAVITVWEARRGHVPHLAVVKGTPKLATRRGNPFWLLSDYQRALVNRRWERKREPIIPVAYGVFRHGQKLYPRRIPSSHHQAARTF